MSWYWYKQGGWEIAVDAVSHQDAAELIRRYAPEAVYQGQYDPPKPPAYSMATAMTTPKRQEQISQKIRNER